MSDTCKTCAGKGGYLQKSVMDPDEVEWDLCAACDGDGVQK